MFQTFIWINWCGFGNNVFSPLENKHCDNNYFSHLKCIQMLRLFDFFSIIVGCNSDEFAIHLLIWTVWLAFIDIFTQETFHFHTHFFSKPSLHLCFHDFLLAIDKFLSVSCSFHIWSIGDRFEEKTFQQYHTCIVSLMLGPLA